MEKGQIAAPSVQMLQKRLPQDKFRRGKRNGIVFHHQQHCRPSWCKAESLKRRRNYVHRRVERRHLWKRELLPTKAFLSFSFSLPFLLFLSFSYPSLPFLSYVLQLAIMTAQNVPALMRHAFFREVWKCELHTVS